MASVALIGLCMTAHAKTPNCRTLSARMALGYELEVPKKFDLPAPVSAMEALAPRVFGMSKPEFKRTFPGGYYEWFALEALRAYEARRTDYLQIGFDKATRCAIEFRQLATD